MSIVIAPPVFWPGVLGLSFLLVGLFTYRRDIGGHSGDASRLLALGAAFVAASLAAFAGEHFTAAAALAQLVPSWLPGRLFIAYFVGAAHLAAASSIVARRYMRWSTFGLALMFALFVLLMDLPGAVRHPTMRMAWSLGARQTTFALGAAALFATTVAQYWPRGSRRLAEIARLWTAGVLVFYGLENLLYPQYWPGVPDTTRTAAWVVFPQIIAYATGVLLVVSGAAMFVEKYVLRGAVLCGSLMAVLTLALYVPEFFRVASVAAEVTALNFVFDTLLFAGTVLMVGGAWRCVVLHGSNTASAAKTIKSQPAAAC